jgi:hypothetical protein
LLLFSEKSEDIFKEQSITRPSSCFAVLSVERVIIENINLNDKVTDKFANHKEGRMGVICT